MKLSDFTYHLPPELIAQRPPERRDGGRLMLLDRAAEGSSHHRITDLPRLLPPQSLLVVNDSRVIPARVRARRQSGGKVELLLLEQLDGERGQERWRCMLRSSKSPHAGEVLELEGGGGQVTLVSKPEAGRVEVAAGQGQLLGAGDVPLPPYIQRQTDADDLERYQTVYARQPGSVAAPTAGLHLSDELLAQLEQAGVSRAAVTLHVGPGTFTPVRHDDVSQHRMEQERYLVPPETASAIDDARQQGRRVVAVGTTVVRTLETTAGSPGSGRSELFIRPGHPFSVVQGLLTNFHLPGSTLLMLVSALAGRDRILQAYAEAVKLRYRFYSYGDAMLIL